MRQVLEVFESDNININQTQIYNIPLPPILRRSESYVYSTTTDENGLHTVHTHSYLTEISRSYILYEEHYNEQFSLLPHNINAIDNRNSTMEEIDFEPMLTNEVLQSEPSPPIIIITTISPPVVLRPTTPFIPIELILPLDLNSYFG